MMSSLPFAKSPARDSAEIPRSEVAYRLYLQANQLARQPQTWMAARSLYRESTAADDRFAPSWAALGRLERVLAKYQVDGADVAQGYEEAERALTRALELSPALPQAHYHYAQLEADTGRTEEALRRLLRRLHVRQTEPEIYAGLVLVCRFCGLLDASVAAHESAAALDPTFKTSIGLTRLARREFEAVLEMASGESDVELRMIALAAMNRRAEALELAREPRPRISESDNIAPMRQFFRAYLEGRTEDAIAALHRASRVSTRRICTSGRDSRTAKTSCGWPGSTRSSDSPSSDCWGSARRSSRATSRVEQFEGDAWLDPIRLNPAFADAMALARARHQRAVNIFVDEGGPGLLGVETPHRFLGHVDTKL